MWIPDPRFEDPSLLVPNKQPIRPVAINWDHPLTRELDTFVWMTDRKPTDLVRESIITDAAPLTRSGRRFFDEVNDYITVNLPYSVARTFATNPTFTDNSGNAFQYFISTGGFSAEIFQLYLVESSQGGDSNKLLMRWNTGTENVFNAYWPNFNGLPIICCYDNDPAVSSFEQYLYVGDAAGTWQGGGSSVNTTTTYHIGRRGDGSSTRYFGGTLGYFASWRRRLSRAEALAFNANPYQFLIPA